MKEKELYEDLRKILDGPLPPLEAKVLAYIAAEYPYTDPRILPTVLTHHVSESPNEIEKQIESLVSRGILTVSPDENAQQAATGTFDLEDINEPADDDDFTERLGQWLTKGEADATKIEYLITNLRQNLNLENLLSRRAQLIPMSSSEKSKETFREDIKWENYASGVDEICIPSFSLESFSEGDLDKIEKWAEKGLSVKILLYHPELGAELEYDRVRAEIRNGEQRLKERKRNVIGGAGEIEYNVNKIKKKIKRENGGIKYRFITQKKHTYFRGLLVRSVEKDEKLFRVFILDHELERGLTSIILRGEDDTTLYRILNRYFDDVWEQAHTPGKLAAVRRNWMYGLIVLPLFGLYLWTTGTLSEYWHGLFQGVAIPIAALLLERLVSQISK